MELTGRSRNVVMAWQNFVDEDTTVLTSPTSFVANFPLENVKSDRLRKVARSTGNSMVFDLDFGQAVPVTALAVLGHNLTERAAWRIRFASTRSGAASDAGGYTFPLASTVYDTRDTLKSSTAVGVLQTAVNFLDHDFTTKTLPAGSSFSRASTGTYFDFTGTMRIAASGEARYDHDPATKAARGILLEEGRTNLLLRSSELDSASWTPIDTVVTSNQATAPDGTVSADSAAFNGSAPQLIQFVSASPATTYTISVWARMAAGTGSFRFKWYNASITSDVLSTNQSVTTTWQRFTFSFTTGASVASFNVSLYNGSDNAVRAVLFWGAQLEVGAFATSYIPTAGSTATRLADVLSMPTSALPFNPAVGTIIATASSMATDSGNNRRLAVFHDGTENNRIDAVGRIGGTDLCFNSVFVSGALVANLNAGTWAVNTTASIATAWQANDFATCKDGASVDVDTNGAIPTVTTLRIGDLLGSNTWCGHLGRITYIASRVSNGDLQTLTNPATTSAQRLTTLAPYALTNSTAPITLGTGSKTVYVYDEDMRFYPGAGVRISIDNSNYMTGTVTAHDYPQRKLTVTITSVVGSGSATSMAVTRLNSDITVWPDVMPFAKGGYWGQFTWGGLISLVGRDYKPPGIHLPALVTGDDAPIFARYCKIEISDTSLSYIDIGRLFVSAAYQPSRNLEYDWSLAIVDPSPKERSRGGQVYADGRPQYRRIELRISGISRDEIMSQVYEMQRELGVRRPFMLIVDPTDPVNLHRLTLYGSRPDEAAPISNPLTENYYAVPIVVEEWL